MAQGHKIEGIKSDIIYIPILLFPFSYLVPGASPPLFQGWLNVEHYLYLHWLLLYQNLLVLKSLHAMS